MKTAYRAAAWITIAASLLAVTAAWAGDAGADAGDAGDAGAPAPAPVRLCVSSVGEARYRAYGYDHIVRLSNACDTPSECSVTTNVNPGATKATVPAHQTVEVLTFRGSPASTFTHQAVCSPP